METKEAKVDKDLRRELDKLKDENEIDVLIYPKQLSENLKEFLQTKKNEGLLDYNILQMANCVVIKAAKKVILEITARDDIVRITMNPKFTAHQH